MATEIVFLNDEKLRELAQLIRGYEVESLKNLYFNSVGEETKYLRICNSNQETVESLLNECDELVSKYENDSIRGPIAALLHSYVEACLNNALQIFTNYTLRRTYLDKITTHVDSLVKELNELDTTNTTDVASLTDQIQNYNDAVLNYTKARVNTHASQEFSRNLKNSGIEFQALLQRYQATLGYGGKFEDLKDEQKIMVYDAIVEASGRGKVLNDKVLKAIASPGSKRDSNDISIKDVGAKAVLLYNAASITWDVYTADHPIKEATRDAIKTVAQQGGAVMKKIVMAAIETGLEGVEVSSFFVPAVGYVVGFLASYILGEIAGTIFDAIFGSGGTATLPNEGFIFYVAEMPDGKDLAKRIAN